MGIAYAIAARRGHSSCAKVKLRDLKSSCSSPRSRQLVLKTAFLDISRQSEILASFLWHGIGQKGPFCYPTQTVTHESARRPDFGVNSLDVISWPRRVDWHSLRAATVIPADVIRVSRDEISCNLPFRLQSRIVSQLST